MPSVCRDLALCRSGVASETDIPLLNAWRRRDRSEAQIMVCWVLLHRASTFSCTGQLVVVACFLSATSRVVFLLKCGVSGVASQELLVTMKEMPPTSWSIISVAAHPVQSRWFRLRALRFEIVARVVTSGMGVMSVTQPSIGGRVEHVLFSCSTVGGTEEECEAGRGVVICIDSRGGSLQGCGGGGPRTLSLFVSLTLDMSCPFHNRRSA